MTSYAATSGAARDQLSRGESHTAAIDGSAHSDKRALEKFLEEARSSLNASGRGEQYEQETISQANYGRNFENYGRNFENYGRNFENYGRNFENYGRSSLSDSEVTAPSDTRPLSALPDGQSVPLDALAALARGRTKRS